MALGLFSMRNECAVMPNHAPMVLLCERLHKPRSFRMMGRPCIYHNDAMKAAEEKSLTGMIC
jgi:hypothetical protein